CRGPRRRPWRRGPAGKRLGRVDAGRTPRRQCGDGVRRSAAVRLAGAPWRGAHAAGDRAGGADRAASRLAPADAGDAAGRHQAGRYRMSVVAALGPALRIERLAVGWRPWLLLLALCLCLFLPGIAAMPPLDRDEARFMQATRQMVESGDLLQIRFQDEARNKKPVGIYWLQAAAVSLFSTPASTAAWPYRLPSLLGATLA